MAEDRTKDVWSSLRTPLFDQITRTVNGSPRIVGKPGGQYTFPTHLDKVLPEDQRPIILTATETVASIEESEPLTREQFERAMAYMEKAITAQIEALYKHLTKEK